MVVPASGFNMDDNVVANYNSHTVTNVREGELRSLETLIAVWGNDPNAQKIVDNYIDTTSDADKLRFIIAFYRENHELVVDSQLSRLLKSKDDPIRFCGILYIRGVLDSMHLSESIPQLSKDTNPGIIAQCDEILKVFSDILSKNESKSLKKQEVGKATANGF
jgi:hypothetical protein